VRKRTDPEKSRGKASGGAKLLLFPGVTEAIALVKEYAYFRAVDKTMDVAAGGGFGDELRQLLNEDLPKALDRLLEDDLPRCELADAEDEVLEELAVEAGPKIAELWELSPSAGQELAWFVYSDRFWPRPVVLVVNSQKPEVFRRLWEESPRFDKANAAVGSPDSMMDGHIYLDVTDMSYRGLTSAYKAVLLCRQLLGLRKQDLREGAPAGIDAQKALECAYLLRMGKSPKEAAMQLGFRVYRGSNPGGSYPLFRKYAEHGREIEQKLDLLEAFLEGLTI